MAFHGMGGGMSAYLEEQKKRGRKTDSNTLKRVAKAFSPYKIQIIIVLFAIILTTVLGLVNPFMIQFIFDDAIGKGNEKLLIILVSIMIIMPIITGLIGVGQTYLNNVIGQQVMREVKFNHDFPMMWVASRLSLRILLQASSLTSQLL